MPLNDATLSLSAPPPLCWLFFADFADLPLRGALFAPCPIHVPTGLPGSDADCAGLTFPVADSRVLDISPVSHEQGGTDTFTFTLFADPADTALMSAIENPALYVGRRVRLWRAVIDTTTATNGGLNVAQLTRMYRGYMTQPQQSADESRFVITMSAENYLALLAGPQGRTDIESTRYDAGDQAGAVLKGRGAQNIPALPGGGWAPFSPDYAPRFEP
jgi:hypothetical protein